MNHPLIRSVTGRPAVHTMHREVWADQVDGHGEPCEVCQIHGALIECNVYVPIADGGGVILSACRCCAVPAALDHSELDSTRDVVVEYSKGHRL